MASAFDSVDQGVSASNGQSNCVVFWAARDVNIGTCTSNNKDDDDD